MSKETPSAEQRFEVGEVAIFNRPGSRFNGVEVTVVKPLRLAHIYDHMDGRRTVEYVYGIDSPAFTNVVPVHPGGYCARPFELKKRPPPQDWVSMCNLTSVPSQDRIEEFA